MDSVNYYIIFSFTTYLNWLLGWLIVSLDKLISWCGNAIHVINLCQLMVLSWCFCHIQIWTRSRKILKCVYGWLTGGGRLIKIQRYTRYSMVTKNIGGNKDTICLSLLQHQVNVATAGWEGCCAQCRDIVSVQVYHSLHQWHVACCHE